MSRITSLLSSLIYASVVGCALVVGVAGSAAAAPVDTTTGIVFSVNPVVQFGSATVTGTAKVTGTDTFVTSGRLRLSKVVDINGNPTSCSAPNTSLVELTLEEPTDGSISFPADTALVGAYGYWVHYEPGSTGGGSYRGGPPTCEDLIVEAVDNTCTGGLLIAASAASSNSIPTPGSLWTGAFVITITNCSDETAPNVTAQGGTSGWSTLISYPTSLGSAVIRKSNGKNGDKTQVLLWTVGNMAPFTTATLTVNISGTIKPTTLSGTTFTLNGPWSVSSNGVKVNDYTSQILIAVP